MNEQTIGELAGDVWEYLRRNGGQADLHSIRNGVRAREGISADVGAGWLAREGMVFFHFDQGAVQVELRS
jgi:hypothetical protein